MINHPHGINQFKLLFTFIYVDWSIFFGLPRLFLLVGKFPYTILGICVSLNLKKCYVNLNL
jgi:hypothetical protein